MADDWESAADSEVILQNAASTVNKWEGEDDDDDVKESWEDEEEKKDEEKEKPTKTDVPVKTKPSKALKAKLEEQARLEEEEEAKRLASLTPEEKLAEKLRLQKIQEDSDLNHALDTFGVTRAETNGNGLDAFNPETKEQFKEFGSAISWKVGQYRESAEFPQFVEDLVRGLCIHLSAADIKKVKMSVEILHSEKLKMEKASAKKAAGKNKGKATLRTESDDIDGYKKYGNDFSEDYDDFM